MSASYEPSISYWGPGGRPRGIGLRTLTKVLTRHDSVVLLLHGYNNDEREAAAAYRRFHEYQTAIAPMRAHVVGVYWPGDNWEGPLYYMQAIGKALEVAPLLAGDLHSAAWARGYYRVDIVAHSLGSRLALETIRQLLARLRTYPLPGLTIGRIVFMAGAVPTFLVGDEAGGTRPLRQALESLEGALNLYSEDDRVLRYAFPVGQSLARQGFFPVALGRREWAGGLAMGQRLRQQPNTGADHSDYWGGGSKKIDQLKQAASAVRGFIDLGMPPARETPSRGTPARPSAPGREAGPGRETLARAA